MIQAKPLSLLAGLALLATGTSLPAAPAPRVSVPSLDKLPQPLPLPYDTAADATRQVARARALAKAQGKKLLIDLGGNWCLDCRVLAGIMDLPEVAAFVRKHYVVVTVDIGRMDKNLAIPGHYGIKKLEGVPAILVVDPKTDRLLNGGRLFALADARSMTPQALANWLAHWV